MMTHLRIISCVLLICTVFSQIYAQPSLCTEKTNCDDCASVSGCGWCAPTQLCLPGTAAGPNEGQCVGQSWEYGHCTPCQNFEDCRTCLVYDQDCYWCGTANNGTGGCKPIGFVGCPFTKTCPCSAYGACSGCIDDANCQWCENSATCQAANVTCGGGPSYNYTTSCPCEVHLDCTSCRETQSCKWCNNNPGFCTNEQCPGTVAQSCQSYCEANGALGCGECTSLDGCAWCPDTTTCVDASTSTCAYLTQCPDCQFATSCDACQTSPFCVWCEDSGNCQSSGSSCFIAHTCDDWCATFTSCTQCSQINGCGWCDDMKQCADMNRANCFFSHSCSEEPAGKCGFDSASFVGGMFLVTGVGIVGVVAFVFYKWKTGPRATYTELK